MYKYIQEGKTPLHYVSDKRPGMVDLLIKNGRTLHGTHREAASVGAYCTYARRGHGRLDHHARDPCIHAMDRQIPNCMHGKAAYTVC
jgi:hypothetical protein